MNPSPSQDLETRDPHYWGSSDYLMTARTMQNTVSTSVFRVLHVASETNLYSS